MVVVVSPITLPEPPAFDAATMRRDVADVHPAAEHRTAPPCRRSARRRCCRGSSTARTPCTSSRNAPRQSSGSRSGSRRGTWLSSKCRDSSAKPSSSRQRFASTTHSCAEVRDEPGQPGHAVEARRQRACRSRWRRGPASATSSARACSSGDAEQREPEQHELERDADDRLTGRTAGARARRGSPGDALRRSTKSKRSTSVQ